MSDIINGENPESGSPEPASPAAEEPRAAVPGEQTDKPAEPAAARPQGRTEYQDRPDRRPPRRFGDSGERGDKDRGGSEGGPRMPKFKRKVCIFCQDKNVVVDYKKPELLDRFITDRGKILPRRVTGTCSKHQRAVAREIKRARIIAFLPFVEK
jgi:small subunit ribosomal protein S18